jgi:glycosyltransferase involved in cell wall biosynthesis
MLIHILFNIKDGVAGGGNNFLASLRGYFTDNGLYSNSIVNADVVLFNSHQNVKSVLRSKMKYPNKLFIHRVDGPMRLYNTFNDKRDLIVNILNKYIADGTIFQSDWSRENSLKMGIMKNINEATIINSPNAKIFYKKKKVKLNCNKKVKLISTSWSSNINKGFEVYSWLDRNLDFNKYEMTFVGNSPVKFNNICNKEPMEHHKLSTELRENDIFILASKKDPCSNALIEAAHCGLPAVALNDGGHPEILSQGGILFNDVSTLLEAIDNVAKNYSSYQNNISLKNIRETGSQYYRFMNGIYKDTMKNKYSPKKINYLSVLIIKSKVLWYRL